MALTAGTATADTAAAQDAGVAHPDRWPMALAQAPGTAIEARINTLLASMSLEQKVWQIIEGDIGGRTYESFGENPAIATSYAAALSSARRCA